MAEAESGLFERGNASVSDEKKAHKLSQVLRGCVRRLSGVCAFAGFDPRRFVRNFASLPTFIGDMISYTRKRPSRSFRIRLLDCYPILDERTQAAGTVGGAYFHQDLWAARKIFRMNPERHFDIGSRIDGFIAHLLVFRPVTVIDIRAIQSRVEDLTFIQDDATHLSSFADNSIESISSLHAAEHFGLGRYSDPVDPDACFKFIHNLQRVLRPGGRLYFSVPIGRERVAFNAHRVFAASTIIERFASLSLLSFSFVDDAGRLHEAVDAGAAQNAEYGCGLFEFTKGYSSRSQFEPVISAADDQ